MEKAKFIRNVLAVLLALATVVCVSCGALFEGEQNVTINLPPVSSSARAISSDKIGDLKNVTRSYRVTVEANGQRTEKRGGGRSYSFEIPVGVVAQITVECLNSSGNVIVRARKTHTVTIGSNSVSIILSRDGEIVELKSAPQIGSIIMKDGAIRTADNIGNDTADAIAVVYKVSSGKAWAVGKNLSSSGMAWATNNADGFNTNITALQEENGYTGGSTGLEKLIAACSDAATDLENKYPAWDYACDYGTNQNLPNFQTGWYLPSYQELWEVKAQEDNISHLISFGSSTYWTSTQWPSTDNSAYMFTFSNFSTGYAHKATNHYVCAVRQFTY